MQQRHVTSFYINWDQTKLELQTFSWHFDIHKRQRAKKVLSDSPGLVDFAIGLANSVFNLPDGQVMF